MSPIETRALTAYFRAANRETWRGGQVIQPSAPETVEHEGLQYVVMSNVNGVLAVYRVRIVGEKFMLKGLKRWPKVFDEQFV